MEILLPQNHPLYSTSNEIKQICLPIYQYFGVSTFSYLRINPDLSRIHLDTNPEWNELFYKNAHRYQQNGGLTEGQHWHSGYCILHMLGDYECIKDSQNFNIGNGVVIANPINNNFTELAFFALSCADSDSKLINLLNNIDLLQKFILFFKERAAKILIQAEKKPIALPFLKPKAERARFACDTKIQEEFNKAISFPSSCAKNYLTRREAECIYWSVKGLSAKEVAKLLSISPRTVEKHLANAKEKLSCKKKTALIEQFYAMCNTKTSHKKA